MPLLLLLKWSRRCWL